MFFHVSLQDGETALMKAIKFGHTEFVKVLLDGGAVVNKQDMVSGVIMHCVHYEETAR